MKLAIVVPCYNEESVISETTKQLTAVCEKIMEGGKIEEAFILYVDDGSQDATWAMIEEFSAASSVKGLKLAHNAGHQNALWAGLEWAAEHVDVAISIDADLQDDVTVIPQMVEQYLAGNEIVYAVRKERPTDTWFKKHSALFFYNLINNLGGDVVYNHADFRLMSRKALVALMHFPERNLFLRGMVRKLGFCHTMVYYDRRERFAGESKYPLRKMLSFALDGITSFSVRPLRFINSGVGKSTLLNAILGSDIARTGAISSAHHKGMHTTTFSEMYLLPDANAWIIDTPGIKGFGLLDIQKEEVGHYFREIFEVSRACRYSNCIHMNEPGCAVNQAVIEGRIALSRYESYLSILDDTTEGKYR